MFRYVIKLESIREINSKIYAFQPRIDAKLYER